ncbi:MAG: right-handed parallel beta-helix repeat-containing protein, partial [Candidatus Thermoplasmatota archaeon]|nr:right-handed parallel beta-helix repeat-containing protein [Candidatus Thermoplasmatota archaeon]
MPVERKFGDRVGVAHRLTMPVLLLFITILCLTVVVQGADPRTPHEPIKIDGDGEIDIFFEDQDGDGLSLETAYLLEDLEIDLGEAKDGIRLMTTSRHVVIRNCLLTSTNATTDNSGIKLTQSSNVTIEDCIIRGTGSGVSVADGQNISVIGISISEMAAYGIHVQGTSGMYVKDATIHDTKTPIVVLRSWDLVLKDVKAQNNQMGFDINGVEGGTIEGCDISQNEDTGLTIEGARNLQVLGNTISFNRLDGVRLEGTFNTTVRENDVFNNRRGIFLNVCQHCLVDDNTIRDNEVGGVHLSGTSFTNVTNNNIRSNWNRGIDLQRSADNTITGNAVNSHER